MAQTTIQNQDAIRTGSAKVELSSNGTTWRDIGAIRGLVVKQAGTTTDITFDNVQKITKFSDGDKFTFDLQLAEVDFEVLSMLKDGQVNATVTAGVDTTVTFNSGGKLVGKQLRITNTRADGKTIVISAENCTMTSAIEMPFLADSEDDVMTVPVTIEGYVTEIVDEQSA